MWSRRITRHVELYVDGCQCLIGWTIDDAVIAIMLGPVTVELWW